MVHLQLLGQKKVIRERKSSLNFVLALPAQRRGSGSNLPTVDSLNAHSFSNPQNEMEMTNNHEQSTTRKRGRPRKYRLPISYVASPNITIHPQMEASAEMKPHMEKAGENGRNVRKKRKYSSNLVLALPAPTSKGLESNVPIADTLNDRPFSTSQNGMEMTKKQEKSSKRGRPRKHRLSISSTASPNITIRPLEAQIEESAGMKPRKEIRHENGWNVGKKLPQFAAINPLGSTTTNFSYSLEVKTGEDICSKIFSFCKQRHMCVLSAYGSVSQALLCRATGGLVKYEGRFDLVRLTGTPLNNDGLSVLLAGLGCKVFGGRLAGTMIAASPVQVILGSLTMPSD